MVSLNNPFATAFAPPSTPSMFDVQRRSDLAKKLLSNDRYVENSGALGALGQALAGSGAAFQNTIAATEGQQGTDLARQALAKALSGGYSSIQDDPSAYVNAASNPFLPPAAATAAGSYVGQQGQLAQQSAENQALLERQKQQQQFDLNTPQPIGWGTQGFINRATGEVKPVSFGDAGGLPLGTTGNPTIDPTMDGYSSKPVGNTGVTQAAIDQSTLQYLMTGTLPPVGRSGGQGQILRNAIMNRAAEIDPTGNLAQNKLQLKALSAALTDQTKYTNNVERAFKTATDTFGSLTTFMEQNGVNPSNYPDLNSFGNYLQSHGKDAPGIIAAYKAQLQTLRQEYSQVLARGGQRSVETDREAAQLIPENLAPAQLAQVQAQLKIDSDNAINAAKNQIGSVNDQIGGLSSGSPAASAAAAPITKVLNGVSYSSDDGGQTWYTQ